MNDKKNLMKIHVSLDRDEEGYPPFESESLWAVPCDGNFVVDNVPFFAPSLALGDVVSCAESDGRFWLSKVLRASGHSTLHVIVYEPIEVPELMKRLEGLGCSIEKGPVDGLVAIDVPTLVGFKPVVDFLDAGFQQDWWDYQESCISDRHQSE